MSDGLKIVICDDNEERARNDWALRISRLPGLSSLVDINPLTAREVADSLAGLEERAVHARGPGSNNASPECGENLPIDDADILIIDYDLTPSPSSFTGGASNDQEFVRKELRAATAETMAYLSRCYSRCNYIVAVNQYFKSPTFDLTYYKFADSRADLNVSQVDIGTTELWLGQGEGFRPWTWPRLIGAADEFAQRVQLVELDARVLESLGLLPMEQSGLDPRQLDLLGDDPENVTFRQFAELPELGLDGRDKQDDESALIRIAAAAVGRWLDRIVLPAQNVLVDIPHLMYRFPSLLPGNPEDLDSWNSVVNLSREEAAAKSIEFPDRRIRACDWFNRPTWMLTRFADDPAIAEVSSPWTSAAYDWVFCEDIARYEEISRTAKIQTDLPGPDSTRFVKRIDNVNYTPRGRLRA